MAQEKPSDINVIVGPKSSEFESVQLVTNEAGETEAFLVTSLVRAVRLSDYATQTAKEAQENGNSPTQTVLRSSLCVVGSEAPEATTYVEDPAKLRFLASEALADKRL